MHQGPGGEGTKFALHLAGPALVLIFPLEGEGLKEAD